MVSQLVKVAEASFLNDKKPVILYGAGNVGRDILRVLSLRGISVFCFLDKKACHGDTVAGVPVYTPDNVVIDKTGYQVVISIFNRDANIAELAGQLRDWGYSSILTIMDIYDYLSEELGRRFWLTTKEYYRSCKDDIDKGYDIWDDETSRHLYKSIIEFRMNGNYSLLPEPHPKQYFPDDLPSWRQPLRLIDAGAYDGDTLNGLIRTTYAIEAIAAFEPEPENFVKLSGFVRDNSAKFGHNVSLYPCGVWSGNNHLCFTTGQGEACQISQEGTSKIQVVALDAVLPVFSPTLIKMDIEGAEYEALLGARRLIERYKPGLAICLYHHPDHIWQIPLLIKDWMPAYKLYMRCHAFNTFELVLYAMQE